jgi:hypothetical protein
MVDKGAFGQVFASQGFSNPTVSLYDSREPTSERNYLNCFVLLSIAFQKKYLLKPVHKSPHMMLNW